MIDNDLYEDYEFTCEQGQVTIPIDLISGEHSLTVEKIGRIDEKDPHSVTLTEICLDDVPLPEGFIYYGIFEFDNISIPQATTFEPDGVWTWKFESPIMDWVLEKKIKNCWGEEEFSKYKIARQEALEKLDKFLEQINNDSKV